MTTHIPKSTLTFLTQLKNNNNRPWFNEHKERYQNEMAIFKKFVESMHDRMSGYDHIERTRTHRIYRDVRFSKNKTPYIPRFSGSLTRATKFLRGGYYFHIEPGNSFVAGGFWGPNSADLKRIRQEIAADPKPLRAILSAPSFVDTFEKLEGDQVKTAPRGYTKEHPDIDLLRYKQFRLSKNFTDEEVLSPDLLDKMVAAFGNMRPFFDYMSEVLTTDANGVPIE